MTRQCILALIVLFWAAQLTRAALPIVTGLSHSLCAVSGDANDSDLYGCPVTGGGVLNVIGTGFSADVVNITSICLDIPIFVSTTLMSCTLIPGLARSVTSSPTAILSNGSFAESVGAPRVHYAYFPVVTKIQWTGEGCLSAGSQSSWPRAFTRCPFDGATLVTITGTNFQNIGPLAGVTFYSIGQTRNLCTGNMDLSLSQSISGGIQTTLICSFVADLGSATTMTNGVLMTNGGNFSIFTSMAYNGPPVITLLEVPTSIQVTPTSVIAAPVYWTFASPGSSRVGVRATNLVQQAIGNSAIGMSGCQYNPSFDNVDILNCTFTQPAGIFIDVVVYNSVGFGRSLSNAGVNVTKAIFPTLVAIRSDWCFQDITSPLALYNCPIFDTTFLITFVGTNFDQYFWSDVCVSNTMIRINSTYAYCNSSITNQGGADTTRNVRISTNAVTQWWDSGATIRWAPRPTFSSLSMSSCLPGATSKLLIGCPVLGSYISLNATQILSFTGTNFFKGSASVQIGSLAQTGAQPCITGTMRVVTSTRLECEFNLQYPLDQMIQTSILVAGGWTDISTGGGGTITFAAAPTVTAVDIPLCTFNSLLDNYTNCPFDGHSPNITVTGTFFNAGPSFTTIMLTSSFDMVCSSGGSTITAITGANAYTTLTCQLIRDSAPAGGSILPAGQVYTNGGNATIWSSLTYAMWPTVTLLASDLCQSASSLSLVDCPVFGNSFAPAVLNITTNYLQPDSTVSMDGYGCESFDRSQGINNIVCRLNYSSPAIGGLTATTAPLTIRNPVGYGYTQTLATVTFASVPVISSLSLSDCDHSTAATLINCPVNQNMTQLTIIGDHFTNSLNVDTNVCVAGSVVVNSTTSAFCTVQANTSDILSLLSITSYGVVGYISTSASIRYAPLPVISTVTNSLCVISPTPRTLSNCPLSGSTLTITGLNIAVGPHPQPNITLSPNPDNITPCAFNTTHFDPAGTWISCEIVDLTQSVAVQVRGILDNITITTTGGTSLMSAALSYQPLPVITSLSSSLCANNGSNVLFGCPVNADGMALLTIRGANFLQGSTVVDSTVCTTGSSLTVVSTTLITCPLANFTGLGQIKSIVISNPALYGGANSTFIAFLQATTLLPPTVTGFFNPSCGQAVDGVSLIGCPTLGGGTSSLTVTGTNFDLYLPTVIPSLCEAQLLVVNATYALCSLASQAGSSVWMATVSTNAGSTTNSLVTLQYAVIPVLDQLLVAECGGSGTDTLYECPTSGGQMIWFKGSDFIGSMFSVINDQQVVLCRTASIVVYNSTSASCLLAADSSYIGTTITNLSVRTFGGSSLHTFTFGFVYAPVVTEVSMNGCAASLSMPETFSLCPFDPLYNLSIIVKGFNFTQGIIPQVSLLVSRTIQFCDAATLFINRTIITCMINPSLTSLPGSVVPVVEVLTQAGHSTVFTQLSFSNRVSITNVQSSLCVVDGNSVSNCPVVGNSDSPFTVTLSVLDLHTSAPVIANGVCSTLLQPSVGTLVCTVNETLAQAGASLPIILVDSFGYMDTSNGVSRVINIAHVPSVTTFSGMDSACKQSGVAGLQDCPAAGGNSVVFNGLYFDSWFQASICDPATISLISSTQVVCELISKSPSYSELIQISTHGTAGWINSTAHVSFASIPSITNISSHQCNQVSAFDIDDCPLKAGAHLNVTGQFLNSGGLKVVTVVGTHDVCISNTILISPDGTWMSCTMSDFTTHLPTLKWQVSLSTNGGFASQNASFEWWPLPRLLSLSSSVCRSFNPTTLVDCPLDAGVALTVNGENFKPDVTVSDPTDCIPHTYVNNTQFICYLAYRPRSAVDLVVVTNPRGYGESLEIASITSSPLAFPIITAFNNTACSRSTSNAGSLINCSSQPGQILTIIGENFDVNNPVYVHDVCGADGPVAISVVSTELAYCPGTIHDTTFAGGVYGAHIQTNGGEAIFPRVTITWYALVAPVDFPISQSSSTSPLLTGLPSNSLQVNEQGNFTLVAPPQKGYPVPSISWEVSYDNVTWNIVTGANTSSLAVSDVQTSMIGALYRPVYTNSLGTVVGESIALYVEVAPRHVDQPPVNVTTTYGTTTTLNATLLGHPIPDVQWQYMSTSGVWVNVSSTGSVTSNSSVIQSSLALGNQVEYLRQYRTCYSNAFGTNCSASIPVYAEQFPRDISTQSVNVTSQIDQARPTLTSTVYGYPTPTVQWFRSNGTGIWIPVMNGTRVSNNISDPATVETSLDLPPETESGTTYYRVCYTNVAGTNCSEVMTVTTIEAAAESSASSLSKGAVAGVVIGVVFGALLICLILYVLLAAALARRNQSAQDGGVAPAGGVAATSGPSSWFAGALCGLAEPQAKQKGAAHDIDFGA